MKNQKTSVKGIVGTLILLGLVGYGISSLFSNKQDPEVNSTKKSNITPFYTFLEKTSSLNTPENTLINYMSAWKDGNWDAMNMIGTGQSASDIKDAYHLFNVKGFDILTSKKITKTINEITFVYTYSVGDSSEDKVNTRTIRLMLDDDYVHWRINSIAIL